MGRGVGTYVSRLIHRVNKKAISKATSPNEAAEILCEDSSTKEEHVQDPVTYDSIESLVAVQTRTMIKVILYVLIEKNCGEVHLAFIRKHFQTKLCY